MSASAAEPSQNDQVPAVFEPPPGNPRFPLFDGLRAVAALGVLLGHCASASGAASTTFFGHVVGDLQLGVTVFFVISGFLLYRPFVASDMSGTERAGLLTFYRRRALRILPGYWFALIAISLLPGVIGVAGTGWWRYFLLIQNYSGFDFAFRAGIGPAWSLSVEVAFYALLPAFAFALRRLGGSRPGRRLAVDLVVLGTLAAASSLARAHLVSSISSTGLPDPMSLLLIITLPFYLAWFAVGMAFASLSAYSVQTRHQSRALALASRHPGAAWLLAAALFAILVVATPVLTSGELPAHHLLTLLVAAAVVFPAAFPAPDGRGLPARLLALRPAVWVGLISYGIYIWFDPIKIALIEIGILDGSWPFLRIVVATVVLAVMAGAFSYYVVERPFLLLKYRTWRGRREAPGG